MVTADFIKSTKINNTYGHNPISAHIVYPEHARQHKGYVYQLTNMIDLNKCKRLKT